MGGKSARPSTSRSRKAAGRRDAATYKKITYNMVTYNKLAYNKVTNVWVRARTYNKVTMPSSYPPRPIHILEHVYKVITV